ncbi:nuclear factor erythroid 2-related factor 3 [Rhineura floridana]|uniref:nuclear factor erythroid 2-related factor 3 n=1 Tax=Rhineura floridana TaxID=261503 RepID=UPI002AC8125D|nr:nuclear factor erythroid 2-related factor 3 [Rhineura floridana]
MDGGQTGASEWKLAYCRNKGDGATGAQKRVGYWLLRASVLLSLVELQLDLEVSSPLRLLNYSKKDLAVESLHLQLHKLLLVREVRALGTHRFPATRVAAWLVQEGEAAAAPAPSASGAAGGGNSLREEASESPSSGPGQCLRRSNDEFEAEANVSASGDGNKCPSRTENVDLKVNQDFLEHCLLPKEDEDSESQEEEDTESDKSDQDDWKERASPVSNCLDHSSLTDSFLPLEGYFPLPTLLTGNTLEERFLGNSVSVSNDRGVNLLNFHNTVNLTQAISHDVSLHDATMTESDHTVTGNAERNLEILETLSLTDSHTALINGTNMLEVFASGNCCRNLTNQDFFLGLDGNRFDEIRLTSLAMEENFDSVEASCLFEEQDSDSGLSLDLNHSSSSFVFTCDSDAESATCDVLGGCCLGYSEYFHTDYDLSAESFVNVLHDHTYSQIPHHLASSVLEHYLTQPEKSSKARSRNEDNKDRNQSRDEYSAKVLRIPLSVNDIVTLPVDSFNSMLSKYYLTDNQLSLIRDIRRRGKNKVAAQNCRKRKLDAIMNLEDDVCHLQAKKERLKEEKAQCNRSISNIKQKLNNLYCDIFSRLRDDQGRPVNPNQYTLHCCENGSVLVVPGKAIKLKQDNKIFKMTAID